MMFARKEKTVLMIGCFDTKGEDFAFLRSALLKTGLNVLAMNVGVQGTTDQFPVDIEADRIAALTDLSLAELRTRNDRNLAVEKMGQGAALMISDLVSEGAIHGAIGMGGGGGTYLVLAAMQAIPFGIPKLCLSTIATKDVSRQVGTKDIVLMPSLVDVAGINPISRVIISQAAGAINGMMEVPIERQDDSAGRIAVSMFGNTTECVQTCSELLKEKGYEVLAFHAVGVGGRTMESLIRDGFFDGVLDITTTELADELCDGICSAGPGRLSAASEAGIPQVVVPGCLDMVNYGHPDTVPDRYKSRQLFSWAPDVTLMRTNREENQILATTIADQLNKSKGQVSVLLPLKGISKISRKGGEFHDPEVDQVLFGTIKEQLKPSIEVLEINTHINDPDFARQAVESLLSMLQQDESKKV